MSEENLIIGGMELLPGTYIDNYRYHSRIGFGGMAEVLLGFDPGNKAFAIKVLKANRFKAGRRRFSREFRTLSKMHHPNVIQVDSYGDIYGHPYIAMEYVKGSDLHKEIRQFRDWPMADRWKRIREVLIDLSKGLAHIHSHGIVHRDLKPSNILIDENGRCVITDFGIVKELNGDVEKSTALVGTWAYASPEQITGQELDHRSDLYSLGIILYAMLCSRRPFAASNMAGYSKLHSEQPPRRPTDFIPEIPTVFEEICLKLLAKSPQDRYQSANDILVDLGEIQGQRQAVETMVEKISFFKTDLPSDMLRTIQQKTNQMTLLLGDEGFGKSRLLSNLEKKLQDLHIPHVRVRLSENPTAFQAGSAIVQYIAKESGDEQLHAMWQKHGQLSISDPNLHTQMLEYATGILRKLLEDRAQVIVIDDIHFALEPTLHFLRQLWDRLAIALHLPLFIFVSSQQRMTGFTDMVEVPLKLLSTQDILDILGKITTESQANLEIIAQRIHEETDGIPLFLNAFIQQLLEERVLEKEGGLYRFTKDAETIAQQNFNIPPSVRQLVQSRLESVTDTDRSILKWMAVSGKPLHLESILALTELDENILFDRLDELVKRRLIREQKSGIDEYFSLRRQKYGSVLYESFLPTEKIHYHRLLAEHLEATQSLTSISIVQQLGEHFRYGDVPEKAYEYLSLTAIRLFERGLLQSALRNVNNAQQLTKSAKKNLTPQAFATARIRLLQIQSSIATNQGDWKEALRNLKTQLRYAKEFASWEMVLETQLAIGDIHSRTGNTEEAIALFLQILPVAIEKNHLPTQVEVHYQMCAACWGQSKLQEALDWAQQGLALTHTIPTSLSRAKILLSMSSLQAHLGHVAVACTQMEEAVHILRTLVQKELLGIVLANLAEVFLWRGLWLEAVECATESLQLSKENFYQLGQGQAHLILAKCALERGLYSEATKNAKIAGQIAKDLHTPDLGALASFVLAQVQLGLDNPTASLPLLKSARSILLQKDPEQYQMSIYLAMALAFFQNGQNQTGKTIIQSLEKHLERAPLVRKIENQYWLTRCAMMSGEHNLAIRFAEHGEELSFHSEMWGWCIKFRALLVNLSQAEHYASQFSILFEQLTEQLPEEEKILMSDHLQYAFD